MKQGSERHWQKQLIDFTGDPDAVMNADGLVDYYAPLYEWLKEENARLGITSGWDASKESGHTNLDPFTSSNFNESALRKKYRKLIEFLTVEKD